MSGIDDMLRHHRMLSRQAEEMERLMRPWKQLHHVMDERRIRDSLSLTQFSSTWAAQLTEIARSYDVTHSWLKRSQLETENWAELLRRLEVQRSFSDDLLNSFRIPASVWHTTISSLTVAFQAAQPIHTRPELTSALLRPFNYYSEFARTAITQYERTRAPQRQAALSGSLVLAEEHAVACADLLIDVLDNATAADDETPPVTRPLIILDVQRRELLRRPEIEEVDGYEEILLLSPTAQRSRKARRIIQAIVSCNRAAKLIGKQEVFTPTTTFIEAQSELVWLAVRDRNTLGQFVDALYLMLYEGAGKDKLRFLEYVGGDECDIIWVLKHLRNKLLRHDPDHGSNANQGKSWRELRDRLQSIGFSTLPRRVGDFEQLSAKLLDEVDVFLEKLTASIEASGGQTNEILLPAHDPEFVKVMEAEERISKKYANALRELAK